MPLTKKKKVAIGASVGAVVLAAVIGVTVYFATKKGGNKPTPGPSGSTWTCVDDGQGNSMLLYSSGTATSQPCAKFESLTLCQAAATAGTLQCTCPAGQVLQGATSGVCESTCFSTATWDSTQNKCVCPSSQQFDPTSKQCVQAGCSPVLTADSTTGKVSGFFLYNGVCTDSEKVTGNVPALNTFCQKVVCLEPSVCSSTGSDKFIGFDPVNHVCIPPSGCNGQSYYYTWPDGSNTCPGLTYSNPATGNTCVPPDNGALQVACEYSAGGCPGGTIPVQPGEICSSGGSCRPFNATPTCPTGSTVNTDQCGSSKQGICYNSTSGTCNPAQYSCTTSGFPCPANTALSTKCASSPSQPCQTAQGQCVGTLVGCRPDEENWRLSNGVCTNVTDNTCLTLAVDTTSTVSFIKVMATVNTSATGCSSLPPLSLLQFRYVLVPENSTTGEHWSGVSFVEPVSSNPNQMKLTIYPDQRVSAVPANVPLNLFVMGLIQQSDGSWTPSINSPDLSDANVTKCQLNPLTPAPCLPTPNFTPNQALQLVPQLSTLSPAQLSTMFVTPDAMQLNLSNASRVPFQQGGPFAGAIAPLAVAPYDGKTSVTTMFVVLTWTPLVLPQEGTVNYVVNKNNVQMYSGPLTTFVDVVSVNPTNSITYSVQASVTNASGACTSLPQFTTCPPLQYKGAMCTSLTNGSSSSLINFMVPDPSGSGCTFVLPGDEVNAAMYKCAYLNNQTRSLAGLQVPNSGNTQCMSIVPVTNGKMVVSLNENTDANGNPTGYCNDASCSAGYIQKPRTAVCGCGADADSCNYQKDLQGGLPYVQLLGADGSKDYMSASDFSSKMKGLSDFMKEYPGLNF